LYKLWYEDCGEGVALLHCTVSQWSIGIARKLDADVADLFDALSAAGFHRAVTFSPNPRFCEYMAGKEIGHITYEQTDYGVYQWELKQVS